MNKSRKIRSLASQNIDKLDSNINGDGKAKKRKNISLATVFVSLIFVSIILSVLISSVIHSAQYHYSINLTAKISSEQIVKQVSGNVGKDVLEIKSRIKMVRDKIENIPTGSKDDYQDVITKYFELMVDTEALIAYSDLGSVLYYAASEANGELTQVDADKNLSFDTEIFSNLEDDEVHISLPHVQNMFKEKYPWVITFTIPYMQNDTRKYLSFEISLTSMLDSIDGVGVGEQGYIYLINDDNEIVYHPKQTMINIGLLNEDLLKLDGITDSVYVESGKVTVVKMVENTSWRVVGVSSVASLAENQTGSIMVGIIILSTVGLITSIIAIVVYRRLMHKPINLLIKAMDEFELDINSYEQQDQISIRELDRLSESFGQLALKIQGLVKQVFEEENELRRTEYKALQSQINPHFLYNTLDSILWMAEKKKTDDVVHMVSALAKLFRISISRGDEFISISDEVEHATSYLKIQSYRYKNKFTFNFNISDEARDLVCNKITLQPIIENCLIHGMSPVDIMNIDINIYIKDDKLCMDIADDGVGMSEEQLISLLDGTHNSKSGIGITNVSNRIKIYFGDEYGVTVDSVQDEGTTVHIILPMRERGDSSNEKK